MQTDAECCIEQWAQVDIDQLTKCTQCEAVRQTDQSVQASCLQSPATVQVTPDTSDADVQTVVVPVVVDDVALESSDAVTENKCVTESQVIVHDQAEEQACRVAPDQDISSSPAKCVIELVEESPSHSDALSSNEELADDSTLAMTTNTVCDMSVTPPTLLPVTLSRVASPRGAALPAVIEQLRSQYDADEVNTVIQFTGTAESDGVGQPAVLQPSSVTDTKYVCSFEQRTVLARSLMLQQSCKIRSVCGGSQAACLQNVGQLVHEIPLVSSTQTAFSQTHACPAVNAQPVIELFTADHIGRTNESCSRTPAAVKPLLPTVDETCLPSTSSYQPSTDMQRSVVTFECSSGKSQTNASQIDAVGHEMTTEQLATSDSLPSVPNDLTQNTALPVAVAIEPVSMNNSPHLTSQLQLAVTTHQTTGDKDAKFLAINPALHATDSSKFHSRRPSEEESECENIAKQQCDQSVAGESQSMCMHAENSDVGRLSSNNVSIASTGAKSEQCSSREQKVMLQTETESNIGGPSDGMLTRGRRRPLFVCRGPLMETVSTLDNMSLRRRFHSDSLEMTSTKLPLMLLGMSVGLSLSSAWTLLTVL